MLLSMTLIHQKRYDSSEILPKKSRICIKNLPEWRNSTHRTPANGKNKRPGQYPIVKTFKNNTTIIGITIIQIQIISFFALRKRCEHEPNIKRG